MPQAVLSPRSQNEPEASPCECLRRRIVKLRWMGLDEEADELCRKLENMSPSECAPSGPAETD
jgi:hypothetical protein